MFHSDISYTDPAMFDRYYINDFNSLSKQEQSPLLLFNFPPSEGVYLQNHEEILLNNHQLLPEQKTLLNSTSINEPLPESETLLKPSMSPGKKSFNSTVKEQIPKKRTAKKDRHSKIYTAQGPRDRRMRLSLEIARKFFDLQDMLGFDKASKTIEWLLLQSKESIKELSRSVTQTKLSSVSSTSECEVVSCTHDEDQQKAICKGKPFVGKEKKFRVHHFARESRAKAREKARERTQAKNRSKSFEESKQCPNTVTQNLNHQLETCEEVVAEINGTAISRGLSCNNNNNFPNFLENWEIDATRSYSNFYAVSHMNQSSGNVQERLPSSIFMATSADVRMQSQFGDIQF